ncbi:MAG: leucine-rich repeat domain-containing protein [Bacteroidota bacterium]
MTNLAQQIIEKEKRERTGYLDLGRCGLTQMPDLSELEWLETLILSNEWQDTTLNEWIYSQNNGPRNLLANTPKASFFPDQLKVLLIGGDDVLSSWSIRNLDFLEDLSALEQVNLGANEITNITPLQRLPKLRYLNLRSNKITDANVLKNLPQLQTLNLSFNRLTDLSVLQHLPQLQTLRLSSCKLEDWTILQHLTQLENLDLSFNDIQDWSFLKQLTQLRTLDLSENETSDWSFFQQLTQLQQLAISTNELTDISFLEPLHQLQYLNLHDNEISDATPLRKLTQLRKLYLGNNNISDGNFLHELPHLEELDLSSNEITNAAFLAALTQLKSLLLEKNEITDWTFLKQLTQLKKLDLSSNNITDATPLQSLSLLESLDLGYNRITDWNFIEPLFNLKVLDISANGITDASFLEKLFKLESLDLRDNQISDASFLPALPHLQKAVLNDNQIQKFPQLPGLIQERQLRISYRGAYQTKTGELNLDGNPLKHPPVEVVKKGNASILEYFRQQAETGSRPLLEAKLVLLGDGRAGKTSLANRLLGKELPKSEDRTQGIDIVIGEYRFPVDEGEFKLNIWDFAGQDKYQPLHQFFYTEGAVYILVVDSGNNNTDFDDWLQTTELFGKASPLVITLNEFREGFGKGLFDEERWMSQYPGLVKEVHLVNLLTQTGFPPLERCIQYLAEQLPHAKMTYPNNWADIRTELESRRGENYITFREYLQICQSHQLPERESALILSDILHKIGVCLHYSDNELLRRHVILSNEWATQAVYQILEDPIVAEEKKGFFDWSDLKRIWDEHAYQDMRPELLELMQEFKLAYPLPDGKEYVTPLLLPTGPPPGWELPATDARIELYIEYKFLPKALLTQFIVSRHADIDKEQTLVWRNGVVLRWSTDTIAEVKAFKSRGRDALYIRSQGTDRQALLTAILRSLRQLHEEYQGIEAFETLPCPCHLCTNPSNSRNRHFFDFANLQNRLEKGRTVVECDKSLEEISLVELLGGVLVFDQLRTGKPIILTDTHNPSQLTPPLAFFSYSKADIDYLDEFRTQLRPLERNGQIRLWDDRQIRPGEGWDDSIRSALQSADIIFLLLSSDFLATDYIDETEITIALERHRKGTAKVIPIQLRPCLWQNTPLGELQGIPRKDITISTADNEDEVWLQVLTEIKGELERFRN